MMSEVTPEELQAFAEWLWEPGNESQTWKEARMLRYEFKPKCVCGAEKAKSIHADWCVVKK